MRRATNPAATIRAMTETRLWDRAAALPARADGRRLPEVATLDAGLPTVAELFDFMRDAELRFGTLRLRIEERAQTARGEELTTMEAIVRHPGDAKVMTTHGEVVDQVRLRALDLRRRARPDLRERPRPRHPAARPQSPARPRGRRLPGSVARLRAGHGAADGDPARHVRPPCRLLPERAGDRSLHGHGHRPSSAGVRRSCSSATTRARPSWPAIGPTSTSRSRSIATPACCCAWSSRWAAPRPAARRSSSCPRTRCSSRPPSTSPSRPARRCSTDRRERPRSRRRRAASAAGRAGGDGPRGHGRHAGRGHSPTCRAG